MKKTCETCAFWSVPTPPLGPMLLAFRSKHEKFIEPAVFNFKWQEWDPIFDSQRLELEKDYEPVAWMSWPEFPE